MLLEIAMRRMSHRRVGLTLIELVVVMAVIAILGAILIPAVQSAREAARRVTCANNLKQFGLAILEHHESVRRFPISVGPFEEGRYPSPKRSGIGWITRVLPNLEQDALRRQLTTDDRGDFYSGGGLRHLIAQSAMQQPIAVLHCPSDPTAQRVSVEQWQWKGEPVIVTSYKGVLGDSRLGGAQSMHRGSEPDCHRVGGCNGIFHRLTYQNPVRMADVRDGTSSTLMVGEDVPDQNNHSAAYYANGDWASCHGPINFFPDRPDDWWDVMTFRSGHPGGAQFCLADGSVRFVSEEIEHALYRALSTKAGREAVGGAW